MGLTDKIMDALRNPLHADYIRLDDDDGISGFVVSSKFERMSGLDRQRLIDHALRNAVDPLSDQEQRQVLMIAGLSPLEYESVGARIRIHAVRDKGNGWLEVLLRGAYTDAIYVQGALNKQKGVTTTEPEQSPGAKEILMTFRAKGTDANPLTKEKVIGLLAADPYIRVMQTV